MSKNNNDDNNDDNNITARKLKSNCVARGRCNHYKSLASYLRYLEGEQVIIELKNGRQISGILQHAEEPSMNLTIAVPVAGVNPTSMASESTNTSTTVVALLTSPPTASPQETTTNSTTLTVDPLPSAPFRPMHLRGAAIRYIHITSDDYLATIRANQDRERSANQKYQRPLRK